MALVIKSDTLIVGEGDRDAVFFKHLCEKRGITRFQCEHGKGIDNFPEYFLGHTGWTNFDELRALIVVADNDADAGKCIEKVQKALRGVKLPAPDNPLEWVKRDDSPKVTIIQMPFDGTPGKLGCLETLVLQAMESTYKLQADCARQLFQCTGADKWKTRSSRDKFLLRSILTSLWEENPNSGLKECIEHNLIPFNHPVFDPLAEVLSTLHTWFDSGIRNWHDWKSGH